MQTVENAFQGKAKIVAPVIATAPLHGLTLEMFAEVLAGKLAPLLVDRLGASPRYADARSNPYGSARAFLDAARRGDFPAYTCARKVTARWADVEAAIEARRRPVRPVADGADADRAELESAGVRMRGADNHRLLM